MFWGRRYKHVVMLGLSGGGWTTTVASAVVTDIELSFPTAGSTPKWSTKGYPDWVPDLPEGHNHAAVSPDIFHPPPLPGAGGDYEQEQARPMFAAVGGYLQMYVLAALEPHRHQVQILHEFDSCERTNFRCCAILPLSPLPPSPTDHTPPGS